MGGDGSEGAVEEGQPLTVVGRMLEAGRAAPDFELDRLDGRDAHRRLSDIKGSCVLNVVNSVDTPVCDVQTKKLDGSSTAPR